MFQRVCMRMNAYLLVAVSLLAAPGCRSGTVSEAQPVVPELKLDGVRFRVYRGDALRALGHADAASLRRDSSEVRAQQLEATLPRPVAPVGISAPAGQGSLLSRVFEFSGGVVASRNADVARTARARYEPDDDGEGMVRGEDPVVVEGPGYRLDGTGFTLDPAAGTIVLGGGARLVAGLQEPPKVAP
jgi:lipopolysaccharide export system protein LptC